MPKHTGVDLLDKEDRIKPDAEILEKMENPNERTSDNFDLILSEVLHANPGGFMQNKYYQIPVPNSVYPDELQFARWYFNQNLLVDFFQAPITQYDKDQVDAEIDKKRKFAKSEKVKYLPIVGSATIAEIAAAAA